MQDPSVSASPLESRIAFLQSKNLTPEEIDVALARAGGDNNVSPGGYSNYAQQQVTRQPSGYGGYQQYPWQQPPPEVPRRDWRDWFIMATVMGGVSYGLYSVAKVLPSIQVTQNLDLTIYSVMYIRLLLPQHPLNWKRIKPQLMPLSKKLSHFSTNSPKTPKP